jgi:nicotinate-nucleotide pyrophosphorylase (carboxylating)
MTGHDVIARALAEDVGDGDVTTAATVPEAARARALIRQKAPGVIYGLDVAVEVFCSLDPSMLVERLVSEGEWRDDGGPVLGLEGSARALLTGERTALNFLQRLSGVATMAARCVRAVSGTGATILDTRKTTPGLRALEKYAVRCGGGENHRMSLSDAVLVKDNHIAAAGGVLPAFDAVRRAQPELPIEVEADTVEQACALIDAGAQLVLLDNMPPDDLRAVVRYTAGRARLEASGGLRLANAREVAETGVDYLAVGALTHSAPVLDIGLDMS